MDIEEARRRLSADAANPETSGSLFLAGLASAIEYLTACRVFFAERDVRAGEVIVRIKLPGKIPG